MHFLVKVILTNLYYKSSTKAYLNTYNVMVNKMLNLIEPYINNISKTDINNFALKNNINLNNNELEFIYNFIKTRYKDVLNNPSNFNLVKYKQNFSNENFIKINAIVNRYKMLL